MGDLADTYRVKAASRPQKTVLAGCHLLAVALASWLLFGGGVAAVARTIGLDPTLLATPTRRWLLLAAAALYSLRLQATTFVFIKRRMVWSEAATIGIWISILDLLYGFFGGRHTGAVGGLAWAGAALYVIGSSFNTGSELHRHLWKQRPENRGQLFTAGLFRYTRHPNYFGDLVLFTGWTLLAGNLWLLIVPALMYCGFAFLNGPALDRYLAEHYGEQYTAWAARTPALIPFVGRRGA